MATTIYTYFTIPAGGLKQPTQLLYQASDWAYIDLQLETAGPVAVGTQASLAPTLGGSGVLLAPSGEPLRFVLARGDRLYVIAEAVNRVKVIIQPLPWIQQTLLGIGQAVQSVGGLGSIIRGVLPKRTPPPPCPPGKIRRP